MTVTISDETKRAALRRAQEIGEASTGFNIEMARSGVIPPPRWIIEGVLPPGVSATVFGAGKAGKSTWTQRACLHVAAGVPLDGMAVQQGRVVYVTAEDSAERVHAMLAAQAHHMIATGVLPDDCLRDIRLNLQVVDARAVELQWLTRSSAGMVMVDSEVIATAALVLRGVPALRPGAKFQLVNSREANLDKPLLVVIDTVSRFTLGQETSDVFAVLIAAADRLADLTGATVALVTHVSKSSARAIEVGVEAIRGHTVIAYNPRASLQVLHVDLLKSGVVDQATEQGLNVPPAEYVRERFAASHPNPRAGFDPAAAVVAMIPVACSQAELGRPHWYVRAGHLDHPVMLPLYWTGSLAESRERARTERAAERTRARDSERAQRLHELRDAVRLIRLGQGGTRARHATVSSLRAVLGWGDKTIATVAALGVRRRFLDQQPIRIGGTDTVEYVPVVEGSAGEVL